MPVAFLSFLQVGTDELIPTQPHVPGDPLDVLVAEHRLKRAAAVGASLAVHDAERFLVQFEGDAANLLLRPQLQAAQKLVVGVVVAAQKKLPLFIFTTFEMCFRAHKMEAETLSDSKIVGLLNQRFIPVKVYSERNPTVIESFHIQSFPTASFHPGMRKAFR